MGRGMVGLTGGVTGKSAGRIGLERQKAGCIVQREVKEKELGRHRGRTKKGENHHREGAAGDST